MDNVDAIMSYEAGELDNVREGAGMRVKQFHGKSGPVANQFLIYTDDADYFQSYRSIIVKREHASGKVYLDAIYWNYSRTTGKYRNLYLNETIADTRRKIADGTYTLANLAERSF